MATPKLTQRTPVKKSQPLDLKPPTHRETMRGLGAQQIIIEGEQWADFERFRDALRLEFDSPSPVSAALVEQLAAVLWRLRRITGFEAGLLSWIAHRQAQMHDRDGVALGDHFIPSDERGLGPALGRQKDRKVDAHARCVVGRTLEVVLSSQDLLGRLGRYEFHLIRQADRILVELRR